MNIIKTNRRALQSGTTLVELSVVIAVILLLVSVLFIGVTAWKNSANRAACLVNLATLQKAVRGYQNTHADTVGYTFTEADLVTAGYFGVAPTCPAGGAAYTPVAATFSDTVPATVAPGNVAFTCPNGHAPANTANW
jgi:type II secretory pathway pseudopilin PulG